MFNTFADVFNVDENNSTKMNGSNPFDLPSSTADPFGISNNMKISESSEKFDDNPFNINTTNNSDSVRPRSGKDALSSSNWLAYQHSMDEANLDSTEDLQDSSLITQSNNVNLNNPFLISTTAASAADNNQSKELTSQNFATDFLFDTNINSGTTSSTNSMNPFANSDQTKTPYDLFDFNQLNESLTSTPKVIENDSKTDVSKANQNKTSSSSMTTKSSITEITPSQSTPTTTTSLNTAFDNQFVDWFSQSDNITNSVDLKLNEPLKKNDINTNKNTDDLFGSLLRQAQALSTLSMYTKLVVFFLIEIFILEENSQENAPSPPIITSKQPIRRPSKEDLPSICIHEPIIEDNDNNIVTSKDFSNKKKTNQLDDEDSDEDTKMVFKIGEKKTNASNDINIPVPLLPPPPSPSSSSSKNYRGSNDDASSSSTSEADNNQDDDDDDDPLAIFRSKSVKNKTNQQPGKNLITDWDEDETKQIDVVQESVCLIFVSMYSLLSCICYKSIRGWCCFFFLYYKYSLYIL